MADINHNALTPCVPWKGQIGSGGYGRMVINRRGVLAHRIAYCIHHGVSLESIKDMVVRHKCDNPPCVNPEHLEIGTSIDNVMDMIERNRGACGEAHGQAKLTDEIVRAVRSAYIAGSAEFGVKPLARKYGVRPNTIRQIVQCKTWKHLNESELNGEFANFGEKKAA